MEIEMQYELVKTNGFFAVVNANGLIVDTGFYDYEAGDFWMKSGVYAELTDILAFWNK